MDGIIFMDRSDYVLLWMQKERVSIDGLSIYCSLCRVTYVGSHCPPNSRCTKERISENSFNNKNHIVIATKDYCNARQYKCHNSCNMCTIKCTYPLVGIL